MLLVYILLYYLFFLSFLGWLLILCLTPICWTQLCDPSLSSDCSFHECPHPFPGLYIRLYCEDSQIYILILALSLQFYQIKATLWRALMYKIMTKPPGSPGSLICCSHDGIKCYTEVINWLLCALVPWGLSVCLFFFFFIHERPHGY